MTSEQQHDLDHYVTFCSHLYDVAFQSLKVKKYTITECRHFATFMVMQAIGQSSGGGKSEAELQALMKLLTPGGRA
jgi:hypothetical protein